MDTNHWYKQGSELLSEMESTRLPQNSVALWFLGQESMVVKSGGTIIYIDPFFNEYLDDKGVSKRRFLPPFKPIEIHNADWVLCTHNHIDHLDPSTLVPMAKSSPEAKFIVPAPHLGVLEKAGIEPARIFGARAGQEIEMSEGLSVLPIPAAHEVYEQDENGDHMHLGYVLSMNGIKLYHAGDTVETREMVDTLKPLGLNIACLPINGADWKRRSRNIIGNMNARDAANVAAGSGADLVIPLHFDLFPMNGENPAHFVDYMNSFYPGRKYHIMVPGERFIYMV